MPPRGDTWRARLVRALAILRAALQPGRALLGGATLPRG